MVRVENLRATIGELEPLTSVTMTMPRGALTGLVGETGSGKSLTLRVLLGMGHRVGLRIRGGSVRFEDTDLLGLRERDWQAIRGRRIALIPQGSLGGLDPLIRVGRQVEETVRHLDREASPHERTLELLDQVRLPDPASVARRYPHELSGGMKQRVMIALALAGRPTTILADEPTTALDVTVQRRILELIELLRKTTGMTVLLVSHDLALMSEVAQWVTVMYAGMTVESGPVEQLFRSPAHPYTRALLAARPAEARRGTPLQTIAGAPPSLKDRPTGCPFAPRCAFATRLCTAGVPPLERFDDGRLVACFRAAEIRDGARS